MEHRDRATIDRYCEKILPEINMFALWPKLLHYRVFNTNDVNVPTWEKNLGHPETVRDILLTIKTRGPYAFENLVRSLRETGHHGLADIIQGREIASSNNYKQRDDDQSASDTEIYDELMKDDFHEILQNSKQPLEIKVRLATKFRDGPDFKTIGRYYMRSKPRGYVLIITIISYIREKKREAAEHDEANLKKLFEDMGFEVTTKRNLTGAQIKEVVREFSLKDFHKTDSCFVIISAHGAETEQNGSPETEIEGIDCKLDGAEKVLCTDIIDFFVPERCKHLSGKPKVFIFQACRGKAHQEPVRYTPDGLTSDTPRNYSDILVAHSTIPGHVAYRDTVTGSWYIQILCEVFMNFACELHLHDLFNLVDRRLMDLRTIDDRSQTSTVKSIGFNKHCYLNPGLFEDS